MNFKKRILTEEIGLTNDSRKTFTNGKKQKVVLNESQLQRLIRLINEKDKKGKGRPKPTPTIPKPNPGSTTGPSTGGPTPTAGGKPRPTEPKKRFNAAKWKSEFGSRIENFVKNKNFKGATKFLNGRLGIWNTKLKKAKGKDWRKQLNTKISYGKQMINKVKTYEKKEKPVKKPLNEQRGMGFVCENGACIAQIIGVGTFQTMQQCLDSGCGTLGTPVQDGGELSMDEPTADFSADKPRDYPTSPAKKMCCKLSDEDGGHIFPIIDPLTGTKTPCPKSGTVMPCPGPGTPPTQGIITTEGRTLKTTNSITESEIKDMKNWFNRINKSGREYNPSKI